MRILLTNTGPWGTGSFTVSTGIMNALVALGHEVLLFFPDNSLENGGDNQNGSDYADPDLYEMWKFPVTKNGITLEGFPLIIPDPHPRSPHGKTLLQCSRPEMDLYFEAFRDKITPILESFQPDIIECQHIWVFDHVIKEMNLPFISVAHHSDQMGFLYDVRMQPITRSSAHAARFIFAVSDSVKKEVVDLYKVPEDKVIIMDNSFNQDLFKPKELSRSELLKDLNLDIPDNAYLVAFVGKISLTKGIDTLIEASNLIPKGKEIHFLIIGSGELETVFPSNLDINAHLSHVHILGQKSQQEVCDILNISDLYTMPSRSEGFGIACLEAMACGLPCVVTRCGGPEKFAIGKTIPPNEPAELAKKVEEMHALSPTEHAQLSADAIERAAHYSWTNIAQKRLKYYEILLAEQGAAVTK